jgi:hypothetical protein
VKILDKAKAAAETAAAKAKEGVEDVQTKRELGQAYADLGKTTFELVEAGELSHARLGPFAERIRELHEKVGTEEDRAPESTQPPAMPV